MPKELYNEGRVVGYSTYELYVKHALAENPDIEPATEKEWLAAQIGNGTSLLLKVEPDNNNTVHSVDFPLPENSDLAAGNTIIASIFFGEGETDQNGWVRKVTNYGQGISNTTQKHPTDSDNIDINTYPTGTVEEYDDNNKKQFLQYLKIQDGVVLQPGTWMTTDHHNPEMDFTPNLHEVPTIRLIFSSQITTSFYILFTSFSDRSILSAISGLDTGSTQEIHPEDGDFLGPELYPWANKIIFMTPPTALYYIRKYLVVGDKPDSSSSDKLIPEQNLRIDYDDNEIKTIFNSSYIKPQVGISVNGPNTKAGDINIGARISPEPNNYLKIEQKTSTELNDEVTTLTHSNVVAGKGISYHSPTNPAENIIISSIVESTNNFLKVEQINETSVSVDAEETTTFITASKLVGGDGIQVIEPSNPGDAVQLKVEIVSAEPNYLKVVQSNGTTTLYPTVIKNSDGLLDITVDTSGDSPVVTINIDWEALIEKLLSEEDNGFKDGLLGNIWGAIKQILSKIGAGKASLTTDKTTDHTVPSNAGNLVSIDWSTDPVVNYRTDGKIPLGNMNIYSSNNRFIKCKQNDANGDLKVN